MAKILKDEYPGKVVIDANNPNGTFKNRTDDILKDGTPLEKAWTSDIWGFFSHLLNLASVVADGSEENEAASQYMAAFLNIFYTQAQVDTEIDNDISTHAAVTSTHGASGDIVGENDTQTLTNKTIEGDGNTVTEVQSVKDQNGLATDGLECRIVEIGDWDMDTDATKGVTIVAPGTTVRSIDVMIRADVATRLLPLNNAFTTGDPPDGGMADFDPVSGALTLQRTAGGQFDSANYNLTPYNRGWITVWYDA